MLYRETGDFRLTYTDDSQIFPIRQDRWAFWGAPVPRLRSCAPPDQRLLGEGNPRAVPGVRPCSHRPQHPDRVLRPALARNGGIHGRRRIHDLQVGRRVPRTEHHFHRYPFGPRYRRGRNPVRPSLASNQGLLSRGCDPCGAVLLCLAVQSRGMVLQLLADGADFDAHPARSLASR